MPRQPTSSARESRCRQLEKAGAGEFPGIRRGAARHHLAAIACDEVLCLRWLRTPLVASRARAAIAPTRSG